MLYDRPVRRLLEDAVADLRAPFGRDDVRRWFDAHYPRVKHSTVQAHITAGTVNDPNRVHYTMPVGDLLYKRSDGLFEPYEPARHGTDVQPRRLAAPGRRVRRLTAAGSSHNQGADSPSTLAPASASLQSDLARALAADWVDTPLERRVMELQGGVTHGFDLVSEDGAVVGDLLDLRSVPEGEPRLSAISHRVWLLQNVVQSGLRLLVVVGDRRAPSIWLDHHGRLAEDVVVLLGVGDRLEDLREGA